MADCFSLPNAAELVEMLRVEAEAVQAIEWEIPICTSKHLAQAADAIEQFAKDINVLTEQNAKLKAELDAAINDIPRFCDKCKHLNQTYCVGCKWEWRGVQNA